ncbi:46085_t:CDS:1, partial [Gigaspora margarita]
TNDKESVKTNAKENKNKNQHLDKKVPYSQNRGRNLKKLIYDYLAEFNKLYDYCYNLCYAIPKSITY